MNQIAGGVGGRLGLYIAVLLFICYLLLYVVQQQNAVISIFDNLDSELIYRVLLDSSDSLFSIDNSTVVTQVMNGIKRNSFNVSAFNVITVLFAFLPPFQAYLINFILVKSVAFLGMYLLLASYIIKLEADYSKAVAGLLALSFALLPMYTLYGLTVAGLPLFTFCIISIIQKKRLFLSYFFIFSFPFYSSLILGGYAILFILGLVFFYYFFKSSKSVYLPLLTIITGTSVLYLVAEVNQLNLFLFAEDFVSHRTAWSLDDSHYGFLEVVNKTTEQFLMGHYHSLSLHIVILAFVMSALYVSRRLLLENKWVLSILLLIFSFSLLYGIYNWEFLIPLKSNFTILKTFQFQRFYILSPFLWYLLFAFCLNEAAKLKKVEWHKGTLTTVIVLNLMYVVLGNYELRQNLDQVLLRNSSHISYKEFFAVDLMNKVRKTIDKPQSSYRIINVGIYPAIAQYSGFYTLDSYQNNYSLNYKFRFRQVIAPELEKSQKIRQYFDNWGNRCYVFSSEIEEQNYFVLNRPSLDNFSINTKAFKEMGGEYILSALRINNSEAIGLKLVEKISSPETPLIVYLYKVSCSSNLEMDASTS